MDDHTNTNILIHKLDYIEMFENKMDELHPLAKEDPKCTQKYVLDFIDLRFRIATQKANQELKDAQGGSWPRSRSVLATTVGMC